MKKLYKYILNYGRMGVLEGLFISDEASLMEAIGKEIYWGEVLGKHSEISSTLQLTDITTVSEDQEFIRQFEVCVGESFGYNPVSKYQELKEEGWYGEEEIDDLEEQKMGYNAKYMTDFHLVNSIAYEKRRMNTSKLRIQAAEDELQKRGYGDLDVSPQRQNKNDQIETNC